MAPWVEPPALGLRLPFRSLPVSRPAIGPPRPATVGLRPVSRKAHKADPPADFPRAGAWAGLRRARRRLPARAGGDGAGRGRGVSRGPVRRARLRPRAGRGPRVGLRVAGRPAAVGSLLDLARRPAGLVYMRRRRLAAGNRPAAVAGDGGGGGGGGGGGCGWFEMEPGGSYNWRGGRGLRLLAPTQLTPLSRLCLPLPVPHPSRSPWRRRDERRRDHAAHASGGARSRGLRPGRVVGRRGLTRVIFRVIPVPFPSRFPSHSRASPESLFWVISV
jgi:hypothetical protein